MLGQGPLVQGSECALMVSVPFPFFALYSSGMEFRYSTTVMDSKNSLAKDRWGLMQCQTFVLVF